MRIVQWTLYDVVWETVAAAAEMMARLRVLGGIDLMARRVLRIPRKLGKRKYFPVTFEIPLMKVVREGETSSSR